MFRTQSREPPPPLSNRTPASLVGEIHIVMLFAMRPVAAKYDYYYSRARMAALTAPLSLSLFLLLSAGVFGVSLPNFKD